MTFCELALDTFSEAGIATQLTPLAGPLPIRAGYREVAQCESNFVFVPEDRQGEAENLLNRLTLQCKVCLECQSFIRPGARGCPACGSKADDRTPDEIRAEYHARWLDHQKTLATSGT